MRDQPPDKTRVNLYCIEMHNYEHTSIHCSISCLRVVEIRYSIRGRIIANHKVDCSLEGHGWSVGSGLGFLLLRKVFFLIIFDPQRQELTPIFCPLSLTRGTFLDGSDLTWPEESSLKEILVAPRNLNIKQNRSITKIDLKYIVWLLGDNCALISWFNRAKTQAAIIFQTTQRCNAICVLSEVTLTKGAYSRSPPRANKPCLLGQTNAPHEPAFSQHSTEAPSQWFTVCFDHLWPSTKDNWN